MIHLTEHFKLRWWQRVSPTIPSPEFVDRWVSCRGATIIMYGAKGVNEDGEPIKIHWIYGVESVGALVFVDKFDWPYKAVTVKTLSMAVQPWAV